MSQNRQTGDERPGIQYRVWVPTIQWVAFDVGAADESAAIEHAKWLAKNGPYDDIGGREWDFDGAECEVKP